MHGRILLVGRFEKAWTEQFGRLARVDQVDFVRDALISLEIAEYAVVLVRGAPVELEKLMEAAPHAIRIEEQESEQSIFLQSILDNLPDMVFVKEAKDLRMVRWNKAGERIVGYSDKEMVGKTDFDLFPAQEAAFFQAKDREVLNSGVLLDIPEESLNSRFGIKVLHTKKIPIFDQDGHPLYLLGISEDITEIKEMKAQEAARLEAAREEERRHLARELHDELGQLLTALKLDLGRLQTHLASPLRQQTDSMEKLLDDTIKTVRRLATQLRPQILDDLGLRAGLEWLAKRSCERTALSFELRWELPDLTLNDGARSALFRICQEALNNVVRHSQATRVKIAVGQVRQALILAVEDNGIGFQEQRGNGMGLVGIRERIGLLGGTCRIERLSAGTRMTVSAPLERCLLETSASAEGSRADDPRSL